MKRTKIIALAFVSAFLLVGSFAPARGQRMEKGPAPVTANFFGLDNMVFRPGQVVEVKWTLEGAEVKNFETNPYGECELFFSADGGKTWARFTPALSVTTRSFAWTVPNVLTKEGVIGLQVGIEGQGDFYTFPSGSFAVLKAQSLK